METPKSFDIEKTVYFRFTSIFCIITFIMLAFWGALLIKFHFTPNENLNDLTSSYVILLLLTYFLIVVIAPTGGFASLITDVIFLKKHQKLFKNNPNPLIRVFQYTFFILFHGILLLTLFVYLSMPILLLQLIPFVIIFSIIAIIIISHIHIFINAINELKENNMPPQIINTQKDNRVLIIAAAIIINLLLFHLISCFIVYMAEAENPNTFKDVEITQKFFAPEQKIIKELSDNHFNEYSNVFNGKTN